MWDYNNLYSAHNTDSLMLSVTGRPCYERKLLTYYQNLYNNNIYLFRNSEQPV